MTGGDPMPIVPVGTVGAVSVIVRDHVGVSRIAGAEDLRRPEVLIFLFGGSAWLRRNFPGAFVPVPQAAGGYKMVPLGFDAGAAADYVVRQCAFAALMAEPETPVRAVWFARLRDWFACRLNLSLAGLS